MGFLLSFGYIIITIIAIVHFVILYAQDETKNEKAYAKIRKAICIGDWIIIGIGVVGVILSSAIDPDASFFIAIIYMLLAQTVFMIFQLIYIKIRIACYNHALYKESLQKEKERKEREVNYRAIQFYKTCQLRAKELKTDVNEVIIILAKNFGLKNNKDAINFFELGKSELKKEKENTLKELTEKELQKEINIFNEEYKKSLKIGHEKYLAEIIKVKEDLEWIERSSKSMLKIGESNANYRSTNQEWGFTSGAMSALFGLGAGIATAVNIQAQNLYSKEIQSEAKETGKRIQSEAVGIISVANCGFEEVNGYISYFNSVLIDDSNIDQKFEKLLIDDIKIRRSKGEQLLIKFSIQLREEIVFFNKSGILDGVLKFTIYHKDKKIAETFYVADGYGEYNYKNAGFKKRLSKKEIYCPLKEPLNFPIEELRCEITPKALWFIEKNENIFKISNDSIFKLQERIKEKKKEAAQDLKHAIIDWKI